MSDGEGWLNQILESLLGGSRQIAAILDKFRASQLLGLVGPSGLLVRPGHAWHQGRNNKSIARLVKRTSLREEELLVPFFAGTMFWCRPEAMTGLSALKLTERDFPLEMRQTDGTTAHAIERLIWALVQQAGFTVSSFPIAEK